MKPTINQAERVRVEEKAITHMLTKSRFFSYLAFKLKFVQEPNLPPPATFCTNGKIIAYNPAFAKTLTIPEIAGVIAHEVWHCAAGHIGRMADTGRDWNLAQMAADYETNWFLLHGSKEPFVLPKDRLFDQRFANMAFEPIYEILKKEAQANGGSGGAGKGGFGQMTIAGLDPAQRKEMETQWEIDVVAAAKISPPGTLPGSVAARLKELTDPAVPWSALLHEYISQLLYDDYSWAYPNKRYRGVIMPSRHSRGLGDLTFVVDTSGSTQAYWQRFLSEAVNICNEVNPQVLRLIQCDAGIQEVVEYTPGEKPEINELVVKGGGGTRFEPVFDYVKENCPDTSVMVFLTDLYGSFPDYTPEYPVIWVVAGNTGEGPFGKSIHIN